MHPATRSFLAMNPAQQREVHLHLCETALAVWEGHLATAGRIRYIESVLGTQQEVDPDLPREALAAVRAGADTANIEMRYREPIVAMQDDDLEFPDAIEYAYYAIYNAFQLHVAGQRLDSWLIVNQALACVPLEAAPQLLADAVALVEVQG